MKGLHKLPGDRLLAILRERRTHKIKYFGAMGGFYSDHFAEEFQLPKQQANAILLRLARSGVLRKEGQWYAIVRGGSNDLVL